jgi:hypothetical protein
MSDTPRTDEALGGLLPSSYLEEKLLNCARQLERELAAARPEEAATAAAIAMEGQPSIKDRIMHAMRDHYWDSLEPQKELVLKHIEGALRWAFQSQPQQEQGK